MELPKPKAGFLIQFWSILSCLTKKIKYLEKCVTSENKLVKKFYVAATLSEKNVVLSHSLGEPECPPTKFNVFFVKKKEAVLISLPPRKSGVRVC